MDETLIDLVKQYKFLYDRRDPDFKNKTARSNAWETISKILEQPAEMIETRWTSLRNRYSSEKRKIRCIPSGSGAYTEWSLLNTLSFLDEHIVIRKSITNAKVVPIESVWETPIVIEPEVSTKNTGVEGSSTSEISDSDIIAADTVNIHKKRLQLEKNVRNTKKSKVDALETSIVKAFDKLDNVLNNVTTTDEDELFALSMSTALKRLDTKTKTYAKIAMLKALSQFEDSD